MKEPKHIIVIGASAGGLNSVLELVAGFTLEMDAAVMVVLHGSNMAYTNLLVDRIQKNSVFTCKPAEHDEPILSQHLYLAIPNQHLLLKSGKLLLGRGATENRYRPAIDVLFRSAAVNYNSRVIGIVLSGLLEDGTTGMQAIKQCGGTCIVQDPEEAEYPDMPKSVLRYVEVDYCTSLERITIILQEKTKNGVPATHAVPAHLAKEAEISERVAIGIEAVDKFAERSPYSCPDCGGALWELKEAGLTRFRCHTGHTYTGDELQESKRRELENTFWVALRILEERRNLLHKMAEEERSKGWRQSADNKQQRSDELEVHIGRMKEILYSSTNDPAPSKLQLEGE